MLADRYDVLEEIGSGATAITYRGHDRRLNRNVAIKILRQDHALDSNYVQRFEREARAAASISQGNVVDVYDFGEQDDSLYIVMQYIDGEDLKHYITRRGALDPTRCRELTTQILAGLTAIHAAGIIHRDIKPQNVLIGRDGIARVTDFGVAQAAIDVGLTTAGTTVGTAAYMAPEQAQAGTLGEATDIYAVGVVLYEMLTGRMPFSAPTPVAMMLAHIQRDPIAPSRAAPEQRIPSDLDGIVMQAMAKQPSDRFRSAGAMSRALAGASTANGATTALPAAPATPGARQATQAYPVRSRDSMQGARPAASGAANDVRPATGAAVPPRRVGSGLRGAVGGLLLLLLLATAIGAAYLLNQVVGDDGNDPTPTVPAVVPTTAATLTPTSEPTVAPVLVPTDEPTATEQPIEQATEVPTAIPTEIPTEVPIEAPTAVPTAASTAIPTEVPTEAPAEQPTIEPVENPAGVVPTETGQGANVANTASGQSAQTSGNAQAARATGEITIEPNAWKGDGVEVASGQEWMVVGPGEEATAVFEVNEAPSGETFDLTIAIAAVDTQQIPLLILLNGNEMGTIADPLPTISSGGGEQSLGTVILTMPAASLQDGRNDITLVNQTDTNGWAQSDDDEGDGSGESDDGKKDKKQKSTSGQDAGLESNSIVLGGIVVSLAP